MHNFWDKAANMFVIRSSNAAPNWLAHFWKTQSREKPSKTFEDNGRETRSCGIKQVLCSFCRSAIGQFSFKIYARRHPCRCVVFRPRKPIDRWKLDNEMNKFLKFPTSETCRRNRYKLWPQWCLGSFEWTSACYDWWMVVKATINQS